MDPHLDAEAAAASASYSTDINFSQMGGQMTAVK